MNTITKAILAIAVIALPVLSGNAYSHQASDSKGGPIMGGMMMDQQQMMSTHKSMHKNQQLMDQIRMENNADKRNKLLQQHMKAMQGQMQMMGKMMEPGDLAEKSPDTMPETMQMMNMRMDMMQMMMGQMMEHQSQDSHIDE
jgi:protein CpxP